MILAAFDRVENSEKEEMLVISISFFPKCFYNTSFPGLLKASIVKKGENPG